MRFGLSGAMEKGYHTPRLPSKTFFMAARPVLRYNGKDNGGGRMEKILRFLILAVLVGAAVVAGFYILKLVFKLIVVGAIVLAILALIGAWRRPAQR